MPPKKQRHVIGKKHIWITAATYIGTVVGAGFASGQEVLQFFGLLGSEGIWAIGLSTIGFWLFGFIIMDLGRRLGAESHLPVLQCVGGRFLTPILDVIMTFFLFGALSAMIAGAGSMFQQEFNIPWAVGAATLATLSLVTVLFGLKGIVTAVSAVVPFLIGGVVLVSIAVLVVRGPNFGAIPDKIVPVVPTWPLAGLTYVSYNIVMSVPVLAALGPTMNSSKDSLKSTFVGALGLGFSLLFVYLAIVSSFPEVIYQEVPMARLASTVHELGTPIYTLIFIAEVYTTAVADLYGLTVRLARPGTMGFRLVAALSTILGVFAASVGFTNLVRIVYPLVGWAGSIFLLSLFLYVIKR